MFENLFNNVNLEESKLLTPEELEAQLSKTSTEEEPDENKGKENETKTDPSGMLSPKELEEVGLLTDDKESGSGDSSSKSSQSVSGKYIALLDALIEKRGVNKEELFEKIGVTDEELKDDPEAVLDLLDKIYYKDAQEIADEYINTNLNTYQKKFVELVEEGLSESVAASIIKDHKAIDGLDEQKIRDSEDGSVAKAVYKMYLKETTKFSDEKIDSEIEKKFELGLLEDEAVDCLDELKEIINNKEQIELEKVRKAEESQKQETLRKAEELKKLLEETDEIAGLKLSKELKSKWKKQYEPVEINVNGEKKIVSPLVAVQMKNPTEFDALLKLYNAMGLFNYDGRTGKFSPNFTALKSLGQNEAVKNLINTIENEQKKTLSKSNNMRSDSGIEDKKDIKSTVEDFAKILGITK